MIWLVIVAYGLGIFVGVCSGWEPKPTRALPPAGFREHTEHTRRMFRLRKWNRR